MAGPTGGIGKLRGEARLWLSPSTAREILRACLKQFMPRHHSAVLHLELRAPRPVPPRRNRGKKTRESGRFDRHADALEKRRRLVSLDCAPRPPGRDYRRRALLLAP